jgi:DNA repair protein RadA/Sms
MNKEKVKYVCRQCGYEAYKWMGRCPGCQSWNSMAEEAFFPASTGQPGRPGEPENIQPLNAIAPLAEERLYTGIGELDRVLGGGAVPGTTILVGGDPGIGKSTLLLQAALGLVSQGHQVLYITGEESLAQIRMRADRLRLAHLPALVLAETEYSRIAASIAKHNPRIVVLDSIQTMVKSELGNVPGSVIQVREITASLVQLAKNRGIIFFIIGHVTKEGALAGPRVLEHMVDCVLYFEGERYQNFRLLRGIKNRFGATNEIGIFTMESRGLQEVPNPSALFLSERPTSGAGSVVVPVMEGTRPLLVEIQGLVTPTYFNGPPRRISTGLDYNRVAVIIAVLEKKAGLQLYKCDIIINVVGGVKIGEPAMDLGVAVSLNSSFRNQAILQQTMFMGEVGLTGEIRPVNRVEERLKEGAKMGFCACILPRGNLTANLPSTLKEGERELQLIGVSTLAEAFQFAFDGK